MTAYLLDVNVLIALSWPEHLHFALARRWFAKHRDEGWATCPLGQTAFVRIVSNPAFSDRSISVQQAMDGLVNSLRDDQHDFWPDSIAMPEVMRLLKKPVRGHQQFTDAYLVA